LLILENMDEIERKRRRERERERDGGLSPSECLEKHRLKPQNDMSSPRPSYYSVVPGKSTTDSIIASDFRRTDKVYNGQLWEDIARSR
jgi:hypothetical protein